MSHMACRSRSHGIFSEKYSYIRYGWDSMWMDSDFVNVRERQRDRERCMRQYNWTALYCKRNSWHVLDSDFAMWGCLVGEARTSSVCNIHSLLSHYAIFLFFSFPCMWLSLSLFRSLDDTSSHNHKSGFQTLFSVYIFLSQALFGLYNRRMQPPKFSPIQSLCRTENAKPISFQASLHFPYILLSLIPWSLSQTQAQAYTITKHTQLLGF